MHPPIAAVPTAPSAPIDIPASKDSAHPNFHINFGKVLATALLGLEVYAAESQASSASAFLTNPNNLKNIVQGFASIWVTN